MNVERVRAQETPNLQALLEEITPMGNREPYSNPGSTISADLDTRMNRTDTVWQRWYRKMCRKQFYRR